MASNSEGVQQGQDNSPTLLASVTGPDLRAQTADAVELTLFRRRLALGAVAAGFRDARRRAAGGAGHHP
jgi:hypothetical protein